MLAWLVLTAPTLFAQPPDSRSDPTVVDRSQATEAWFEQEALPRLETRRLRAELRHEAARAYFLGEEGSAWQRAFPELVGAGLGRPVLLRSRIAELSRQRSLRVEERVAPPPEALAGASLELETRWRQMVVLACDAEDGADLLEERFLVALERGLARAPGLTDAAIAGAVDAWWRQVPAVEPMGVGGAATTEPEDAEPATTDQATIDPDSTDPATTDPATMDPAATTDPTTTSPSAGAPGAVATPSGATELEHTRASNPLATTLAQTVSDAQRQLLELQLAAWRHLSVPGDRLLAIRVEEDLDRLARLGLEAASDDPARRMQRSVLRDRLRRAMPLLADALAQRVGEALVDTRRSELEARLANLQETLVGFETSAVANEDADAETLRQRRRLLDERAATLAAGPELAEGEPLAALLEQIHAAEQALVQRELEWVAARLELADAKAKAATADRGAAEGTVEDAILQLRQVKVELLESEEAERGPPMPSLVPRAEGEEIDAFLVRLCRFIGPENPSLTPFAVSDEGADAATQSESLREWIGHRRATLSAWRSEHADRRRQIEELARGLDVTAHTGWGEAEADLERVLANREQRTVDRLHAGFTRLSELKRQRRHLVPEASSGLRDRLRDDLWLELRAELDEAPLQLELRTRQLVSGFDRMRNDVGRLSWWSQQLVLGAELLVLLLLWTTCRSRLGQWLDVALRMLEQRRQERRRRSETTDLDRWTLEGGLVTLGASGTPVLASLLDGVCLAAIQWLFLRHLPLVGLLGVLALILLGGQVVARLVALAAVTPKENRPGILVVSDSGKRKLLSSVRWALAATVLVMMARYLARRVFDADAMLFVIHTVGLVLVAVFGLWMLLRWQGALRGRASQLAGNRMAPWLGADSPGVLGTLMRSAVAGLYLAFLGPLRLLVSWFGHRRELAWLGEALARQDLEEGQQVRLALDDDRRQAVLAAPAPQMERPVAAERLRQAFGAWRLEGRRGLVLVLGDRGMGKSHFLGRALEHLAVQLEAEPKLEVTRWPLHRRIAGAGPALLWLGRSLGLDFTDADLGEEPDDLKQKILDHLAERPPTLFVLDDLQYLMLRTVGGFEALQVVLAVMLASAERHFWLVSMHEPAWTYLQGLSLDIAEDMFRAEIRLQPWTPDQLRDWLEERTRTAGYTPVYDRLLRRGSLRRETAGPALQRAKAAYWRLLGERSRGNPEIATVHWLDSLCRGRSERRLAVTLFDPPPTTDLVGLDDDELFVLTALTIHGRLTIVELARVLNLSTTTIKVACRHLLGLGILDRSGERGFVTCPHWRMSARRHLRQRHFLYEA